MRKIIKKIIFVLISINFLYLVSGVIHFPLRSVDVYAIWMFKAKAFYLSGGFPFEFVSTIEYFHPQYPVLLPYLFSLIYKLVGGIYEFYVLGIYPFLYLGILYAVYKVLRSFKLDETLSLVLVYIYSMFSPLLAQGGRNHAGSADIVVTFLNWMVVYFALKLKDKKHYIYLVAILIAISSQIKMEGVFYSSIILFLSVGVKRKLKLLTIAVFPSIVWFAFRTYHQIPTDLWFHLPSVAEILSRSTIIISSIGQEMLNVKNWYVFWPIFWMLFFARKQSNTFLKGVVYPTMLIVSSLYFAVYLTGHLEVKRHVDSSIDRIMLQMSPFFFPLFGYNLKMFSEKKQVRS